MANNTVIYSYSRTAVGAFQGSLSNIPATELGSIVIKSVLEKIYFGSLEARPKKKYL